MYGGLYTCLCRKRRNGRVCVCNSENWEASTCQKWAIGVRRVQWSQRESLTRCDTRVCHSPAQRPTSPCLDQVQIQMLRTSAREHTDIPCHGEKRRRITTPERCSGRSPWSPSRLQVPRQIHNPGEGRESHLVSIAVSIECSRDTSREHLRDYLVRRRWLGPSGIPIHRQHQIGMGIWREGCLQYPHRCPGYLEDRETAGLDQRDHAG